jgi:hypothetical protein
VDFALVGLPYRFLLPRVLHLQNQFFPPFFLIRDKLNRVLRVLRPRILAVLHQIFVELLKVAFGGVGSFGFGVSLVDALSVPGRSGSVAVGAEVGLLFERVRLWLSTLLWTIRFFFINHKVNCFKIYSYE